MRNILTLAAGVGLLATLPVWISSPASSEVHPELPPIASTESTEAPSSPTKDPGPHASGTDTQGAGGSGTVAAPPTGSEVPGHTPSSNLRGGTETPDETARAFTPDDGSAPSLADEPSPPAEKATEVSDPANSPSLQSPTDSPFPAPTETPSIPASPPTPAGTPLHIVWIQFEEDQEIAFREMSRYIGSNLDRPVTMERQTTFDVANLVGRLQKSA